MMAREFTVADLLALKPGGSFTIEAAADGRQLITINWPDGNVDRYNCPSPGLANQLRLKLSDDGLAGFIAGAD